MKCRKRGGEKQNKAKIGIGFSKCMRVGLKSSVIWGWGNRIRVAKKCKISNIL